MTARQRDLVALLGLTLLALLLVQPWTQVTLDPWDYGDFHPKVEGATSTAEALGRLIDFFGRANGRFNVVFWATIAAQWRAFGFTAVAWEWVRWSVMLADVVLLFVLVRRMGGGALAATAATLPLVVATTMYRPWTQLMAEPLVLAELLLGAHLALGFRTRTAWAGRAGALAGIAALVAVTKEVTTPGLLVPWLVAISWDNGWQRPRADQRTLVLTTAMGAAVLLALIPAFLFWRAAPSDGYATGYGAAPITFARWLVTGATGIFPVFLASATTGALQLVHPANIALLLLLGWGLAVRPAAGATGLADRAGYMALLLPLIGLVAYLPWPVFHEFYAAPYLLGVALAMATAATRLAGAGRQVIAAGLLLLLGGAAAMTTAQLQSRASALRELGAATWQRFPQLMAYDSVFFAVPASGVADFPANAGFLVRTAIAAGDARAEAMPPVVDVPCPVLEERVRQAPAGRVAVVSWFRICGPLPEAQPITAEPRTGWPLPTRAPEVMGELYAPRGTGAPGR